MSGNGSRTRSRYYGTTGDLLPTPRPCSGLRSSGANQTELLMSAERIDAERAGHSQGTLFETGSEDPSPLWPTPRAMPGNFSRVDGKVYETSLQSMARKGLLASTSSRGDTHANHSHSPGSDWARRMTAHSGRSLLPWLPTSALGHVFWRMFTDTSAWGSTTCWLTWRRLATPAGRSLYRLAPSTPRTGATGFGSLPETLWPTPRASPNENRQTSRTPSQEAGTHGLSLAAEVCRLLPTPTVQDGRNNGGPSQSARNTPPLNSVAGGKLSAAWVTAMMGFPAGWLEDL